MGLIGLIKLLREARRPGGVKIGPYRLYLSPRANGLSFQEVGNSVWLQFEKPRPEASADGGRFWGWIVQKFTRREIDRIELRLGAIVLVDEHGEEHALTSETIGGEP